MVLVAQRDRCRCRTIAGAVSKPAHRRNAVAGSGTVCSEPPPKAAAAPVVRSKRQFEIYRNARNALSVIQLLQPRLIALVVGAVLLDVVRTAHLGRRDVPPGAGGL